MTIRFGSLFSGIGGFDLGLERAGMSCAWQVEIEPYCLRVLEKHWPEVKRYGDIKEIDWIQVEPVDLICGGFPCQPFSVAGKRRGAADERNLWPEMLRAIRGVRPRWVLGENVPGISSYLDTICVDLEAEAYEVLPLEIPAAAFGAPHLRYRLFIVAHAPGTGLQDRPNIPMGKSAPHAEFERQGWWDIEPDIRLLADGLSQRLDGGLDGWTVNAGEEGAQVRWPEVRRMWRNYLSRGSPHGWKSDQQLARELADVLRRMSYPLALAKWETTLAATFGYVCDLRKACKAIGALRDPSVTLDEAWQSLSQEDQGWTFLAARGGRWVSEWPGVSRVATGIPHRVDRLRTLGNAVVPQVAQWIGERIIKAEGPLTSLRSAV